MSTTMHRLQISLPVWQVEFLTEQARRRGISMAEVIRQLIQQEIRANEPPAAVDSIWEIAGIAEDHGALLDGVPVSEQPERYLAALDGEPAEDKP